MSHWGWEDWGYFLVAAFVAAQVIRSLMLEAASRIDGRLLDMRQLMIAIIEEQQALRGSADLGHELQDIRWAIQEIEKALPTPFERDEAAKALAACADRLGRIEVILEMDGRR